MAGILSLVMPRSRSVASLTMTLMPAPAAEVIPADVIDEADLLTICAIWRYVFPPNPKKTLITDMTHQRALAAAPVPTAAHRGRYHVARDAGRIVAVAKSFIRTIKLDGQSRPVLALLGVACLPDWRGRGLGNAVVLSAFQRLQQPDVPASLCLFQTDDARPFYEKLGCRVVPNRFINSQDTLDPDANPWWNPWAMIHPAAADWRDEATVDLCGPGW